MSYWPPALQAAVVDEAQRWHARRKRKTVPPWESWLVRALTEGVEEELARLGRAVMREALMQGWSEELQAECGWLDDGQAMLELALDAPTLAAERWNDLLDG
jgi:hypothetical protein